MGKKDRTDKKARTNNIEALRKKYEALLLEDKKRKERNQYILEKMDTMRTCNTLVHKNTPNIQHASFLLPTSNSSVLQAKATDMDTNFYNSFHHKAPDTLAHTNATAILKDIYNNFILIPKVFPTRRDNSAQVGTTENSENDANSDWKSKYDILDKLKQEEKEDIGSDKADLKQSRYVQQFDNCPNQPISSEKSVLLKKDVMVKKDNNSENYVLREHSFENLHPTGKNEPIENIQFNNNNPPTESANIKDYPFSKIEGSEKIEHLDNEGINPVQISYNTEDVGKPFGEVPTDTDDVQYPIDVINVHDFTPEKDVNVQDGVNINPEGYNLNNSHFVPFSEENIPSEHGIREDCFSVNPKDMDKNQTSFNPILSQTLENDTTAVPLEIQKRDPTQHGILDAALAYQTSDNVPQNTATTELSFNTLQTVPVPEHCENFDVIGEAENAYVPQQQEVFYQEPISEVQYDQTAEGDTWATTANETIGQDEPYYYEGQEQDQQAPVYVNEHEETSTLYDQNYEQQYMTNYEQQEFPEVSQAFDHVGQPQEYETQQYDQQEYDQAAYSQEAPVDQYNQEMEYDQQQHQQENYNTVQQVDEQLSQEEGYADVNQAEVAKTPEVLNDNEQPPKK